MTTTAQRQHQKDALHREAVRLTLTSNVERVLRERINRNHNQPPNNHEKPN